MDSSKLDSLLIEEGQRVVLIKTGPAFGSERSAEAVLDVLGIEGVRRCQQWFEEALTNAGIVVGSEGAVESIYTDGYVEVLFDGTSHPLDIPTHCLLPITAK